MQKFIHQRCTNLSPLQFSFISGPQGQNPFVCDLCTVQSPTSIVNHRINTDSNGEQGGNWDAYKNVNFINSELKSEDDLFILHMNIVSLVANFDSVQSLISQAKVTPHFICISESRLNDKKIDWQTELVNLPNYELHYDNSKTSAGGVAIYVHEDITSFEIKSEMKIEAPDCESLFVEIKFERNMQEDKANNAKKSLLLGCVYRHPRWATSLFFDRLCEKLAMYSVKNIPVVLVGDFNINTLDVNCNRTKN